jgi:hypothetical protein
VALVRYRYKPPRPRCLRRHPVLSFEAMWPKRTDGLCRCGCGEKLVGRERSWRKGHEVDPVQLFKIAKGDSDAIRSALADRDHGVCALCGLNTQEAAEAAGRWFDLADPAEQAAAVAEQAILRGRFMALGFPSPVWYSARRCNWWEADHTVPLVEGGTNTLENLRTLCVRCHSRETKALAARRAQARRPASLELFT